MYECLSVVSKESLEFCIFQTATLYQILVMLKSSKFLKLVVFIITTQTLNCLSYRKKESFCCQMGDIEVGRDKDWMF